MPHSKLIPVIERLKKEEEVIIAGLGDSLTYGWMVEKGFFDRFVDGVEKKYPGAVIRRINAGMPGDTASGGSVRLDMLLRHNPDLVTIQFGLNDLYAGHSVDSYETRTVDIVSRISDADAVPVLVVSCPLYEVDEQVLADGYYDVVRSIAREQDVPVADLSAYWLSRQDLPEGWAGLLQSDGVHPTDTGHAIMAEGLLDIF